MSAETKKEAKRLLKEYEFVDNCNECGGGYQGLECAIKACDTVIGTLVTDRAIAFWEQVKKDMYRN